MFTKCGHSTMAKAAKPIYQHAPRPAHNAKPKSRKRLAKSTASMGTNPVENMTELRWKKFISAIASGKNRKSAAKAAGISPQTVEAYLISNVSAYKQIRDAQLIRLRQDWPADLLDDVFNDLAGGLSLKRCCLKHGLNESKYKALLRLVRKDKAIREAYDDARDLWAESFLDDTIDIADDTTEDRLPGGKINHEVVNRSKLRIDARWRAMGAMVKKRFGDHKHVELEGNIQVNHIALLTGARKRLESAHDKSKPKPVTIDNETGDLAET